MDIYMKPFLIFFHYLLMCIDTRETAFVNAVVAAGVTYTVTQACSSGQLLQCTCDKTMKGQFVLFFFPYFSFFLSSFKFL
jgi:hypothetical protein